MDDSWIINLNEAHQVGDCEKYLQLALLSPREMSVEVQLLAVFHGWKCGQLDLLRMSLTCAFDTIEPQVEKFLLCHELRANGAKDESIDVLQLLASECKATIVQYRYAADFIEFGNLDDAFKILGELIPRIPLWGAATLRFNLGITALNQSKYNVLQSTLDSLASEKTPISTYFSNWLSGQQALEKGDYISAIDPLRQALELAKTIPSRTTDVAAVAGDLLTAAFWAGRVDECEFAYQSIVAASAKKQSTLGINRQLGLHAMIEIVRGDLSRGQASLNSLFLIEGEFTRDHLTLGFLFLWINLLIPKRTNSSNIMTKVIPKLKALRTLLKQSEEFYDFTLFEISYQFQSNKIESYDDYTAKITRLLVRQSQGVHSFHLAWAKSLLGYFNESALDGLIMVLVQLKTCPILERLMLLSMARKSPQAISFWRLSSEHSSHEVTRQLAQFHYSRLTNDPSGLVRALVVLGGTQGLSWFNEFSDDKELSFRLLHAKALIGLGAKKVVAIQSGENLDDQPLLGQLFITLFEHPLGIEKEALALSLGWSSYDPTQHDPIVHNLVFRLRAWLSRNISSLQIQRSPKGWSFNSPDLIQALEMPHNEKSGESAKRVESHSIEQSTDLPPRLEWIMHQLAAKKTLTRSEVLSRFDIKKSSVVSDFNDLIERGLVRRVGAGRGVYYQLIRGES